MRSDANGDDRCGSQTHPASTLRAEPRHDPFAVRPWPEGSRAAGRSRSAAGEPAMGPPAGGPFIVSAIGTARLDGASELTRYYDDDHRMIQVIAAPGAGPEAVADVSLYAPWDSVVPGSAGEWNRWTGPRGLIGAPDYDADGIAFARFWG
ncbi:MAG: DUF2491 family protein, partial [Sphingomonadales bacterium]